MIILSATLGFFAVFVVLFFAVFKFTFVKEGTAKIVLKFGAFDKVLLAKTGYAMDADGNIGPGEQELGLFELLGGLRFVGIRFIHTIYKRDFTWVKSLPDGVMQDRSEADVDFILASVDYQYGLRITKAESKDLLDLNAQITLTARVVNPYKALFAVKDWFDAVVVRIAPAVREYISNHTYEEIISDPKSQLDRDVIKQLRLKGEDGSYSIIDKLRDFYGIEVLALETVNIDPDETYRKATLEKWQAERDAEAELVKQRVGALSFASETSGREISMISQWLGTPVADLQTELRAAITADPDHGFEKWLSKYPVASRNWNLIQQKVLGVRPTLVGDASGGQLDPLVQLLAIYQSLKSSGVTPVTSGNPTAGQGNAAAQPDSAAKAAMIQENFDWYFKTFGKYSPQDPRANP